MSRKVARFVKQISSVPREVFAEFYYPFPVLTLVFKNFVKTAKDYSEFVQKIGRSRGTCVKRYDY